MSQGSNSVNSLDHLKPSTSVVWLDNKIPIFGERVTTAGNPMTHYTTRRYKSHSYQMGQFYSHRARINAQAQQQLQEERNVDSTMSEGSNSVNSLDRLKPSTSVVWLDNKIPIFGERVTTAGNPMTHYTTRRYKSHSYQMGQFYSHRARINAQAQQQLQEERKVDSIMSQGDNSVNSLDDIEPPTSVDRSDNISPIFDERVTTADNPMTDCTTTTIYKSHSYQMGQLYSHCARINAQAQQQLQEERKVDSTMSQGSSSINS